MTDRTVAPELPSTGTYRIDPSTSSVRYSGKHMFGTGTVHATFTISDGELHLADDLSESRATVTVDAGSFASGNPKRDKDVRSGRLLDVENHPAITFVSDGFRAEGDGWVAGGTVTAHGRTAPVEVTIDRMVREGNGLRVHGRADHLDRTAFGITGSRGMVGRYLDLELDAFALPV
jgi:polyisoprenoid-binding protein YceI